MKTLLTVIGVLFILTGFVWILQGINVLPGSFMTGQIEWAYAGVVMGLAGAGLIILARRRRDASPAGESDEKE
jgi:hypothetical protein